MCLSERNTLKRGRSGDPNSLARERNCRRSNRAAFSLFLSAMSVSLDLLEDRFESIARVEIQCLAKTRLQNNRLLRSSAGERLAVLNLDDFAFVSNALALVW